MQQTGALLLYLVCGVLFVLGLHAMTRQRIARRGLRLGAAGLVLAAVTTLAFHGGDFAYWLTAVTGLAIGGFAGTYLARGATAEKAPKLIAAFHAAAGLAALLLSAAALHGPDAFGIGTVTTISGASLVEIAIAAAFGSVAFAGSLTALAIAVRNKGAPAPLPGRIWIEGGVVVALVVLTAMLASTESRVIFWLMVFQALALGILSGLPEGRTRTAAAAFYGSCAGWATAALGFILANPALIIAGALTGSAGVNIARRGETPDSKPVIAEPMPAPEPVAIVPQKAEPAPVKRRRPAAKPKKKEEG